MDKIRSPTSMSMQPQNLSVSMAGTPGTPMVTFLLNVSSTGEKNSGVPPTQLAVSRGAPTVGREDQASPSLTPTCRRFQSWTSKEMYKHASAFLWNESYQDMVEEGLNMLKLSCKCDGWMRWSSLHMSLRKEAAMSNLGGR